MGRKPNDTSRQIRSENDRYARENEELKRGVSDRLGDVRGRSDALFGEALTGYRDLGSRFSGPSEARSGFQNFAQTGGVDPASAASLRDTVGGFRNLARTGGAGGFYGDLIKTGGYSPEDVGNIRRRASSTSPSFYENLKADMSRRNSIQGGYGVNVIPSLSREAARARADDELSAELGLSESIREGRLAGAEGFSRNEIAGLGGAANTELGLVDRTQRGQMFGLEGLTGLDQLSMGAEQASLAGIRGLRNDVPAEDALLLEALLGLSESGGAGRRSGLGIQAQEDEARFDRKRKIIGAIGGGVGSAFGAGG